MDLSPDEDNFQGRLLHQAALWDNVELVQELLSNGAAVDAVDLCQRTALHAAALAERSHCLSALIAAGANVDARCDDSSGGKTALHIAAERGHMDNVKALIAAGADLSTVDASGNTALGLAEKGNHRHAALVLRQAREFGMLQRIGSLRYKAGKAANEARSRTRVRERQTYVKEEDNDETEDAFDVKQYFADDVADPWREEDVIEREHTSQHTQLRDLLTRGEVQQLKVKLSSLGKTAGIIVNLTPNGANTLLYVASEAGLTTAAAALLDAGADGRAHSATKYSPLYIACYHGHVELVKLLLVHFPEAVQQETVEKWLPLHAACMNGHANVVSLLLDYPYPKHLLRTYTHTDSTGEWQYLAAFDVNALDARGNCALHVACAHGDVRVVDVLLCKLLPVVNKQDDTQSAPTPPPVSSPVRAGISLGIHAIVSKLTGSASKTDTQDKCHHVRPVRLDILCGGDSCVARAARRGHTKVLQRLLQAGASANAPAAAPPRKLPTESRDRRRSRSASASTMRQVSASPGRGFDPDEGEGPWTALAVAARAGHAAAAALLLQNGATDPHNRALRHCSAQGLKDLFENLLSTKAYADPECKLNKSTMSESIFNARERDGDTALTYNALCPTTPVVVNWRELKCQLAQIRITWLRAAVLRVNPKLSSLRAALHALTRLDVANNELTHLPAELFTLLSLRYLNAAQNKLERLPSISEPFEEDFDTKGRRLKKPKKTRPEVYSAPVLQELHLQDNRLEELPAELFSLPALVTLDVSNNKLRELPSSVWRARSLQELGAALNHLKDLPAGDEELCDPGTPTGSTMSITSSLTRGSSFDSKPYSRSPSLEEESQDEEDSAPSLGDRTGNAVCLEASRAHAWRGAVACGDLPPEGSKSGGITSLDLSHNQFSCIPRVLACRAPNLLRLNMAYNSLRTMSYVTSYPAGLRQLDLSHNEITCWPSLPQVESFGTSDDHPLTCYCAERTQAPHAPVRRPRSGGSARAQLLAAACPQRRHLRLEGLRTLLLSNNMLTRIQLTTDDDGEGWTPQENDDEDDSWGSGSNVKGRLLFPLLSMLDVSCNLLRAVPPAIHELTNLAVLNISGNKDITDLPPQMGLLSRLWNLNAAGCSFAEPLCSMVASGKYKSMHIVGYLKSVLQEAKVYTRMRLMLVGVQGIGKTSLLECLRQESPIQHRRKNADHWTKRMGNKISRGNMSTVGVDIGSWTYEKNRSQRAPVTFRTWDFGGQHEYYATHQYFLSRRSLYLVLWRVTDGRRGLAEAVDWLRSIQARAPGSPVIMVATHYDQVANSNLPESESPEALQRLIRSSIMGAPDADKLGLPKVLDSVEVSCSTRHNIRLLADIIYSVAYSIKLPGSKEPLLEQRVPATYLALEECVTALSHEHEEPVLRRDQYKRLVTQYMQQKNHRMFRDAAELHQATMFLHENGVLLHYDDATLRELYFIRVQWLCDVLAHVVTVREINPFANSGIMKVDDLAHVFKSSPALARGDEASSLAVSLLTKFELALCWDARMLLVPSLLPKDPPQQHQLPLRSRSWGSTSRWPSHSESQEGIEPVTITGRGGTRPLRRLLVLSYVPCGFWPRLIARLLAEPALAEATKNVYTLPNEAGEPIRNAVSSNWGWAVWRTGLRLDRGCVTLLTLREVPRARDPLLSPGMGSGDTRIRVRQEGAWCDLDVSSSACVEILLPAQTCVVKRGDGLPIAGYQSLSLEPNPETLAKVLALISDHVDLLLEDWYPSLGTRFVHTSEGRSLITRVVPCPECWSEAERDSQSDVPEDGQSPLDVTHERLEQAFRRLELELEPRPRLSEESRASDGDSGVGAESNTSSRLGSVEGAICDVRARTVHGWTVEECVLCACTSSVLRCPVHGAQRHANLAPDTLLLDIEESCRARWDQVTLGAVVGRGAFGTVLAGSWRSIPVAVKALQPVFHHHQSYKVAQARWERDPIAAACRAYCGLRQELTILVQLKHPHVVPLVAVCASPLALLLELAPQGALWGVLRSYRACGARVGARALRALALQVARALEYLHARRIVYRDLKSENVLVWSLPKPAEASAAERSVAPIDVHVKLADYGISRQAPPSGTKGFGGTEGFMAPEIMRYNGEEEYNEKVDCFSYGMLLYEIITLRQPFEGHEAVKEAVLEGARPALAPAELQYPCNFLETMRRCWTSAPELRPSAAALVSICAAPECLALQDAALLSSLPSTSVVAPTTASPMLNVTDDGGGGWEVWCGREALLATPSAFTQSHAVPVPPNNGEQVSITASCRVSNKIWLGDSSGRVCVYSASTCSLIWAIRVHEAVGGVPTAISALLPLPRLQRVALALPQGRLFLVTSHRPEAEGSFVLTELGAATELCCLTSVSTPHGCELWAGGDALYCYGLSPTGVREADTLSDSLGRVTMLAACDREPFVFLYCEPGVCIYQWSVVSRQQTARLDCSKLAPCSESLQSIAIDQIAEQPCTVLSLCVLAGCVYAGTKLGSIIVAAADTLRPLTVFRVYEQDVHAMVPLLPHKGAKGEPMLATFGTGYRPLVQRFAPPAHQSNATINTHTGTYCLLWRAGRWLPD